MSGAQEAEARISFLPVEEAKRLGKEIGIPSTLAPLNPFRALLNHPELAKAVSDQLSMLLWKANRLDLRLRELIIMRIGWRTGSFYEWTQHWHIALRLGLTEDEVLAVRDWRNSKVLNDADRAVLQATDDTLDRGRISDAAWAECRNHIGDDAQLAEMVVAIGNWRSFSELLQSLAIPLEDGTVPWPPDGAVPPANGD